MFRNESNRLWKSGKILGNILFWQIYSCIREKCVLIMNFNCAIVRWKIQRNVLVGRHTRHHCFSLNFVNDGDEKFKLSLFLLISSVQNLPQKVIEIWAFPWPHTISDKDLFVSWFLLGKPKYEYLKTTFRFPCRLRKPFCIDINRLIEESKPF